MISLTRCKGRYGIRAMAYFSFGSRREMRQTLTMIQDEIHTSIIHFCQTIYTQSSSLIFILKKRDEKEKKRGKNSSPGFRYIQCVSRFIPVDSRFYGDIKQ